MEFESENRLTQQFKRITSDRTYEDADINAVNDNINKNIYIRTKNMRDSADEMDYFLDKMDLMGKASIDLINNRPRVEASAEDKTKKKAKRKVTGIMGGIAAAIIPLMFMGGSLLSSKSSAPVVKTNNLKTSAIKPPEKEDNIFGLTSKDKANLRQLNVKADDETSILDKVTRIVSSGFISSFGALVFGHKTFKDSNIYKLFKDNLKLYSKEIAGIFNKVIKNIFTWIRDNIITPIKDLANIPVDLFTSLKEKVIIKLKSLTSINDSTTEVGNKTKKDKTVKSTILTSINNMLIKYIGSGILTDKVKSFKRKNKDTYKNNTRKTDGVYREAGVQDPEFADFSGMPEEASLSTAAGTQLGVYSALRRAGFSDRQSRIFTAEIGREGSYKHSNIFGVHGDPKNGYANIGMISWQKERNPRLVSWMTKAGLMSGKNMARTQASIDMQAKFIMHEIMTDPAYKRTKTTFLGNPNVSYNVGKEVLGNNYIRWVYTNSNHSGHKNRDLYYTQINNQLAKQGGQGDDGDNVSKDTKLKSASKPIETADAAVLSDYNMELELQYINRRSRKYSTNLFLSQSTHTPQNTQSPKRINTSSAPRTSSKTNGTIDNTGSSSSSGASKENNPSLFEILMYNDISGNMLN